MKKKKLKILLWIICILVLILFIKWNNNSEQENIEDDEKEREEMIEQYMEGKIFPQNLYRLRMTYKGDVNPPSFYEAMYKIVMALPEYKKVDLNNNYYKDNEIRIKYELGITDEETFENFCTLLKNKDINTSTYTEIKFDEEYMEVLDDGINMKLVITYSDTKVLTLKLFFSNRDVNPIVKIVNFE